MSSDSLIALIGVETTSNIKILASWNKLPTQQVLDTLTSKFKDDYVEFVLMKDILYVEGRQAKETSSFDWS